MAVDDDETEDLKARLEQRLQDLVEAKQFQENAEDVAFIDRQINELKKFMQEHLSELGEITSLAAASENIDSVPPVDEDAMDGVETTGRGGKRTLSDRREAAPTNQSRGMLLLASATSLFQAPPPPLPESDDEQEAQQEGPSKKKAAVSTRWNDFITNNIS